VGWIAGSHLAHGHPVRQIEGIRAEQPRTNGLLSMVDSRMAASVHPLTSVDTRHAGHVPARSGCMGTTGGPGGKVYDALLIECARAAACDRIYTFNRTDFERLAPDLQRAVAVPCSAALG